MQNLLDQAPVIVREAKTRVGGIPASRRTESKT
jgi:hypothetical protein